MYVIKYLNIIHGYSNIDIQKAFIMYHAELIVISEESGVFIPTFQRKDEEKSKAELVADIKLLRSSNASYKEIITRYMAIFDLKKGKSDDVNEELSVQGELVESLRGEIQGKNEEIQQQHEELSVQNEELHAQVDELRISNENYRKAMEALDREKSEAELYLDLMGHDISNMHQIAIDQLELAEEIMNEDGKLELDNKELIDTPLKTLERSARLIGNVRKLQKLRSGEYKSEVIDLGKLLTEIVNEYSKPHRDATIHYTPVSGCYVMATPLLKDVFINLMDNAIKHSNCSPIIGVDVGKVKDDGTGQLFYRVAVEDNGPGILDSRKEDVFRRFKQGQTTARGTGLGLYIVKKLVESFNGNVRAEDVVRGDHTRGSRFLVYLPARG